ncbi:phospholipase D delta [Perilla frutescens var. hirtella]|uniref:phospholipase D n=1 Tax=Perilla frutescens var. hirtella TaxID=608512 RepID=A0AAD4IUG7_PERFH|nr:phospholipase D delta [Perilla frutescens var. hirtella]
MEKTFGLSHLFMTVFLHCFSNFMVVPALTDVTMAALCPGQDECSLAIYLTGAQQAIIGLGSLMIMPLVGNLSDIYGRKVMLTVPMTLSIFPLLILAYSRTKYYFYAYYVLKSLIAMATEGSVQFLALAYVADNVSESRRAAVFGIMSGFASSSFVFGNFSTRFLSTSAVFQVAAAMSVVALVYMRVFLQESMMNSTEETDCLLEKSPSKKWSLFKTLPSLNESISLLRTSPTFSKAATVAFFINVADVGLYASLMYYLKAQFHFNKDQFADLMIIAGIAGAISQLILMPILTPLMGEEKMLSVGLFFSCAHMVLYSIAWAPWVRTYALNLTRCSYLKTCTKKYYSMCIFNLIFLSFDLSQGKVQGCITGICSFASVVSPLAFSPLTALFLSENAPFNFPGFSIMCSGLAAMIAFVQSTTIRPPPTPSKSCCNDIGSSSESNRVRGEGQRRVRGGPDRDVVGGGEQDRLRRGDRRVGPADRGAREAVQAGDGAPVEDKVHPVRGEPGVQEGGDRDLRLERELLPVETWGQGDVVSRRARAGWDAAGDRARRRRKVKLVREATRQLPRGGNLNLGDLLKHKSQEGVRVLLLVWDDKTSHSKFFINTTGVMDTHDEETKKFFKHSSVTCVLAPRYGSNKLSIFKQQVVGTIYTHHQKCVIVDTQDHGNNRKITSFIGGLDLCDGRYDTPEHRLYRDLKTVFHGDYHNPTLGPGTKGPRQPWHDLHCKIEGPAAYDILTNFEQRWKKATKWSEIGQKLTRFSRWHDALIKIDRISWIKSPSIAVPNDHPLLWVNEEKDPENWHVQIFRSIDSGSLKGFPKTVRAAEEQNLVCAKNLVIDRSIQMAYIQAIRSAQHFIYIENQYFLGSSYAWPSYRNADNLIPMELALKIVSKIRARERFTVYIVIPMWPEGVPSSASVQEILYWQGQTMQMMYEIIAKEIKSSKLENAHPTDYLNFYCLGNREKYEKQSSGSSQSSSSSVNESSRTKSGRFMIYVHAKGMIVDDEYVIIGSANINQRSMAGSRDTEIAMGAYQPHHTWAKKKAHPFAQVYGYRMSLWAEHLGKIEPWFEDPDNEDCVKYVNEVAEENWKRFTADKFTSLQGHILKYPVEIDGDGKVNPMRGFETFPDVGGKVLGAPTNLPDALTT